MRQAKAIGILIYGSVGWVEDLVLGDSDLFDEHGPAMREVTSQLKRNDSSPASLDFSVRVGVVDQRCSR
jgi:hypothetical protein